jgi:adenosylhomocysteine nucleosidase
MIGILGAMDIELAALLADMEEKESEKISGFEFFKGKIAGRAVVIAKCGIGKVAAAVCAQTMILRYAPSLLLHTGVAGTLTTALSVTDVAIGTSAVQHDMDTSALGDPVGLISGINKIYFEADAEAAALFLSIANESGIHAVSGTIASGDQFISGVTKKRRIVKNFKAIACEMEGGAVAHAAYLNNTPFIILRAISDNADGLSHMDYPTFLPLAAARSYQMVKKFLARY